jgi:hypothetical protein
MGKFEASAASVVRASLTLSLRELAKVLVKHYGHCGGQYDLLHEYQIRIGAVEPDMDNFVPSTMIGVTRVGLVPAVSLGPNTVDSAKISPTNKMRGKASRMER